MKSKTILVSGVAVLLSALPLRADVREGLVAYWPFETAAGGGIPMTTPDVVGGNTMTGPGKDSTTALVAGKYGNAVTFAGLLSDYLFFTNAPGADTGLPVGKNGSWTYSLWVKGAPLQADQTCPFGEFSTTDGGGNPRYEMMMYGTGVNTNKLRIFMRSTGGTVLAEAPTTSDVYDSTWHHIAYTYDISAPSNRFRVYVDGVANYTNSFNLNQGVSFFNCVSIGARVRTSVGLPFTGDVDDVALWSRALSQGEIQDVMTNSIVTPVPAFPPVVTVNPTGATNLLEGDSFTLSGAASGSRPFFYQWLRNGTNVPGANANSLTLSSMTTNDSGQYRLVITNASSISVTSLVAQVTVNAFGSPNLTNGMLAYWPLDTITGVKTPDLVSAYDMTLGGTANPTNEVGKWGNAMSFNGANFARVIYAPGSALPAYTRTNFTVSFWVKAPDAASGWAFSEASTVNNGAAFVMGKNNNGKLYTLTRNNAATVTTTANSATTGVWDDNWHNIVYVQHDAGGTPKASLYIDGVLDTAPQNPIYGVTPNNTALGAYSRLTPNVFYTGLVDEVVIWGRPLSPAEITLLQSGYITNPPSLLLPLAISSFKSDLPAVATGDSTVLRWDVPALTTQVLIDKLGDVTSKTVGGIGTTNLTLTNTTTYVLTVIRDTISLGHEVVKATNTIGVVDGVAANWHLLDNFDFYSPGVLATNGWWVDLGSGGSSVSVVTPTNCNRLVKTLLSQSAAYLRLNNLTVLSNQSATLFFRMIPQGNSTIRHVVGITDKPANFYFQLESQVGPAVQPTVNDPSQNPGDWLLAARNIPYSALTFDTNVLATGAVYNVWIDVTNVFIGDRIYPDNYDMFSVYLQKEGDPGRTTVFSNFTSDRDLVLSDPLTGGLPTENLTRIFLGANNASESALFDDFYLSKSGYNATIPRAVGYAGPAPTLQLQWTGSQWQIVFQGKLLEAASLNGTWSEVTGATSPYPVTTSGDKKFYRAVCY